MTHGFLIVLAHVIQFNDYFNHNVIVVVFLPFLIESTRV